MIWSAIEDFGHPDGSSMDADGCLWNARYSGGLLPRIVPDDSLGRKVDLPATNITACTCGGQDNSTSFVTTASNELDGGTPSHSHEGALLAVDACV